LKASVVIANFNSEKYIAQCINSLKSQTYKDLEIIFFDDNSSDNSLDVIKKFSDVKVIENKKQTNFGSLNQLNAFKQSINQSTGDLIFFLDSDDYFHEKKIETIVNYFKNNLKIKITFDLPIYVNKDSTYIEKGKKNFFKTYWPFIHPTSCIIIRKDIVKDLFNSISTTSYTDVWMDLRLGLYAQYILKNFNRVDENLTYYRKTENNISSKFKKYSKNWWKRRNQAHEYFYFFCNKNGIKFTKNLDYLLTKLICSFIKR
tara:strand:- start:1525 stop:2301 length:777 start_codon:yes stop_codon:yes gene_type:complete